MRAWKAVFWSFFGIRKGQDLAQDATELKPAQVILAGLVAAAIFVGALVSLVYWITH